jgi:hypothetical protein
MSLRVQETFRRFGFELFKTGKGIQGPLTQANFNLPSGDAQFKVDTPIDGPQPLTQPSSSVWPAFQPTSTTPYVLYQLRMQ